MSETFQTDAKTFVCGTREDEHSSVLILTEVLEQRTGNQEWYVVNNDTSWYDFTGQQHMRYPVAIHGRNDLARKLWHWMNDTPEMRALGRSVYPLMGTPPSYSDCSDWDDQTKRRLEALCWTKLTEHCERYSDQKRYARKFRVKANKTLRNVTVQTCSCGHTHEHTEGPRLSVPTPADVRSLIEAVVDKHLVKFLTNNSAS